MTEQTTMREVKYFRAIKQTHRFNKNQKVWIRCGYGNHMHVWFKWRGKGRYVSGVIDRFAKCVGEIKKIPVDEAFANRIEGDYRELNDYRRETKGEDW